MPDVFKALYRFEPQDKEDLDLVKGDLIDVDEVTTEAWGTGTCRRTGKRGSFPWNFVEQVAIDDDAAPPPIVPRRPNNSVKSSSSQRRYQNVPRVGGAGSSATKEDLSQYPWYAGAMSRSKADQTMRDTPDGTFLVRDSSSHQGYSLTVRYTEIRHVRIEQHDGKFGFSEPATFNTMVELVQFFEKKSLACYNAELETKLLYPYKEAPREEKNSVGGDDEEVEEQIYMSNREALRYERQRKVEGQRLAQYTDIYDVLKEIQMKRKAQSVICRLLKEQKQLHETIDVTGPDQQLIRKNYEDLKARLFDADRNLTNLDNKARAKEEEQEKRRQSDAAGLPQRRHGPQEVHIDERVDRTKAEELLRDKEDGCYVFRKSQKSANPYALTMRYNQQTKHIPIKYDGKRYGFAEPLAFYSLTDLCEFYKTTTLSNTIPAKLTHAVSSTL